MRIPPTPQGTGLKTEWEQFIADQIKRRLQIQAGRGIKLEKTVNGTVVSIDQTAVSSGSSSIPRWG